MTDDRINGITSALPMPVLLIGPDDRVLAANEAVEVILGPNLVGRHYITALRQPALIASIADARRHGEARATRFIVRDGPKDVSYRVAVGVTKDEIVLTFEDQTAAEEAGQMRRDFVANVSHELRTPLTALLGFIETLGGAARDDAAARDRFLAIMAREAARMTRLVDDLLSLSRVEEDERVRPSEMVDLAALLSSVIKGLEPQAADAGVVVRLSADAADEKVPGDPGQLVQVFTNLIENAVKYGGSGGAVTVTFKSVDRDPFLRRPAVRIEVKDNGPGIDPLHIPRLTERFYRIDSHRSREMGGTGLGLAIVKHIVNRHRGRMKIESALGQGSTFAVILPKN